jgi:hypothetical protein
MEQLTQQQKTLADAALANKLNVIHHAYVDIAGDLIAGALMGQILYWFGQGKDGRSRARIVKDGHLWIAKTRADWWDEIRISPKQYDRAAKILKDRGFIELRTFKFNGNPTTHIRIVPEAINAALDAWKLEQVKTMLTIREQPAAPGFSPLGNNELPEAAITSLPEAEQGHSPAGNMETPESGTSLTEIKAENEKENTAEPTHTPEARPPEGADAARHRLTVEEIAKGFEETWAEYPRKEGKAKARIAYEKAVRGIGTRKPDGLPYTHAEILTETVLYRQHIERRLESGDLEPRYIPTGGAWFEREGWVDDIPSISSTFADLYEGVDYNRNAADLRRLAASVGKAPEAERPSIWQRFRAIRAALPY